MKTPYLSIKQRFLLLVTAVLIFGLATAIHAEGLSGLKDSLNKGKINKNEVEPESASQPDATSEPSAVKAPVKIKRITDTAIQKGKSKFVFVNKKRNESKIKPPKSKKEESKEFNEKLKNDYNKMLVTLKQARKKKKASPRIVAVRIEDNPEDSSIPAKLPEDFLINVDTDELVIRNEVKTLYDSFESLSLNDFNKTCEVLYGKYYKTRPDICHLIKLIKADAKLKKDQNYALEDQMLRMLRWPSSFETVPYPTFQTSMHEEYLKMSRDTEAGNDLLKFVNKKAKKRQEQIKKANDDFLIVIRNEINVLNKLKADYEAYVKELLSLKHILPGSTSNYENNEYDLQYVMRYAIDDIKAHYSKISQRYLIIAIYLNSAGQWEESLNLTKEFKDYFEKNCPYKFTIKLAGKIDYDAAASSGNLGNLKIIEKDLIIDKDNLKWGPKRIDQAALECMSRLSLQNITDQVNNLEFHKKIIEFAETNIADQEEIKQYKKETKVKEIRFETNEFSGTSNSSRIFAANARICIKCYYEPGYNQYYQKPVEINLKSSISNRDKKITIICNRGESVPYAIFRPNEDDTSNDKVKNLIKKHGSGSDELKHSICLADGYVQFMQENINMNEPDNIYKRVIKSEYFKDTMLGIGVTRKLDTDTLDMVKVNNELFSNMGFEVVNALINNSLYSKIFVNNQANWFIFDGHASALTYDGEVFTSLVKKTTPDAYDRVETILPQKFKLTNLNFLVLLCCNILSKKLNIFQSASEAGIVLSPTPSGIVWRKVVDENIAIIGYNEEVKGLTSHYALSYLFDLLENEFKDSPYTIQIKEIFIDHWLNINKELYINALIKWCDDEIKLSHYLGAIGASAILGKYYYHILPDESYNPNLMYGFTVYNNFIINKEDISELLDEKEKK